VSRVQMSSSDAKRKDGAIESLENVKLRALKEGKFTDCTFLVGPDDGPQEVYACT
jgi:hypothetical protein